MKWLVLALCLAAAPAFAVTPALIQNVSSSTNPLGVGIDGNDFAFTLPNAVIAGNALVLKIAYLGTASFALTPVTDSNTNTWPTTPSGSQTDSNSNVNLAVFVLPNAHAGVTTITFHFTAPIHPVQYGCGEWNNIATVAPVNGSVGTSNVPAVLSNNETVSLGSFTPGNNDANGGNLILAYIWDDANPGSGNAVNVFTAGTSFTLLDADIMWNTSANAHHASEYFVQTTAAAINPSFTVTWTTASGDPFVGLAIALKVASAGGVPTTTGPRIVKMAHYTNNVPGLTLHIQFPTTGSSLLGLTTPNNPGCCDTTFVSVTDTGSNTWTPRQIDPTEPIFYTTDHAVTGPNLKLTVAMSSTTAVPNISVRMFEFGSGAVGTVDGVAGLANTDCSDVSSIAHAPDITPASANGLTVAVMGIGNGPGLAVASPTGGFFDLVTYTGETDLDTMENADAMGHFYNPDKTPENWTWTITNHHLGANSNSCFATAVHFSAPPPPPPQAVILQMPWPDFSFVTPYARLRGVAAVAVFQPWETSASTDVTADWIQPGATLICQGFSSTPLDVTVTDVRAGAASLVASSSAPPANGTATVQCMGGSPQ